MRGAVTSLKPAENVGFTDPALYNLNDREYALAIGFCPSQSRSGR